MSKWIVTVNLHRKVGHNPKNKIKGVCPIPGMKGLCTDTTGDHHSFVVEAVTEHDVRLKVNPSLWITRIEEIVE